MHTPRKRFGQNFLNSDTVIHQMVQAITPRPKDKLVEIGPGQGALTEPLLNNLDHLDIIELDRDLIPILRAKFITTGKIEIHEGDVLNFDFQKLINTHGPIRVVGNLPYNISTDLLFYLLGFLPGLVDMHFLLQKEVVDRLSAPVGSSEYGRLSVLIQYYCEVQPLFLVSPDYFYPVPKVMSQFVRLIPRRGRQFEQSEQSEQSEQVEQFEQINFKYLDQILRAAFQMRRKTLRNNFKKLEKNYPAVFSDSALNSLGIDPDRRPQNLNIQEFIKLAQLLSSHSQD